MWRYTEACTPLRRASHASSPEPHAPPTQALPSELQSIVSQRTLCRSGAVGGGAGAGVLGLWRAVDGLAAAQAGGAAAASVQPGSQMLGAPALSRLPDDPGFQRLAVRAAARCTDRVGAIFHQLRFAGLPKCLALACPSCFVDEGTEQAVRSGRLLAAGRLRGGLIAGGGRLVHP